MCTRKEVLGWLIDGQAMTVHLTERRHARLVELLDQLPQTRKRVSVKLWHKVMGELRSMVLALPGSRGLFSVLQHAFKSGQRHLRVTLAMHDFLDDFRWVVRSLHARPTRVYELFPSSPAVIGATDASGYGMGGVFFVPLDDDEYNSYVWRADFPSDVQSQLVTYENPSGIITNSDLEMAATVGHHDVVAHTVGVAEATIGTLHDNAAAMFWNRKGSASMEEPAAYLLRLQALHARQYRYMPTHDFIPGDLNVMGDDAS